MFATYPFGHSDAETRHLQAQVRLFGPMTRRLLEEAGIATDMRGFEVGSGAGDVALVAADLVGTGGEVVGDPVILETARARAG
jgi:hypothetical protein